MIIAIKTSHQIKAEIKRLYKEYDQHLDSVIALDDLLVRENSEAQRCLKHITKYSQDLHLLEKRG